jgi:hypothetical protein
LFGTNHHNAAIHYRLVESLSTLEEKNHLFEQTTNLVGSRTRATNLVASHHYCDIGERIFDSAQKFIALSKQFSHEMGAWDNDRDGGSNGGHVPSDYLSDTEIQAPLP